MGLSSKQYANNPVVDGQTMTVMVAAAAAPTSLLTAINTAIGAPAGGLPRFTGLLISASTGNDVFVGGTAGPGTGVKITAGTNLFLAWGGGTDITYESGATPCAVMVFMG